MKKFAQQQSVFAWLLFGSMLLRGPAVTAQEIDSTTRALRLQLVRVGEVCRTEGRIVRTRSDILIVGENGKAVSPFSPQTEQELPKTAQRLTCDPKAWQHLSLTNNLALQMGETLSAISHAKLDGKDITIAAVLLPPEPDEKDSLISNRRIDLRIYHGQKELTHYAFDFEAYAGEIIVANFVSPDYPEIALTWASVGNHYSAGVTVFQLKSDSF